MVLEVESIPFDPISIVGEGDGEAMESAGSLLLMYPGTSNPYRSFCIDNETGCASSQKCQSQYFYLEASLDVDREAVSSGSEDGHDL